MRISSSAGVGAVQPPGRVQARRERKADRALVHLRRIDARDCHQRAQTGLGRRRERAQAAAHERAVLADQRDDIGDRRERDQIELAAQLARVAPERRVQRLCELVCDGRRAQLGARIATQRRVHDRRRRQRAVRARRVVVGDDHLDPERLRPRDRRDRGDRAVDGHEQARAALREALDRRLCEPVAVARAIRQVGVDVAAERAQRAHQHRRRADAVDVVVAVDRDPLAAVERRDDRRERPLDPGERLRGMLLGRVEEGPRLLRLGVAAPDEHLRERRADGELALQAPHIRGRARGDLELAWLHPARLRRG